MKKIYEEEKECNEKLEILTVKIKKCNNELNVLNNKYTQLQAKTQLELKKNEELKERLVQLQSDKKKQGESFEKTCSLYSNAISKYTNYLGIKADFDEIDNKIINIYFVNDSEGFHDYPNMIIESLNKNNKEFKVKKLDNHMEDDDLIYNKSFKRFQIAQLVSKLQNSLNSNC
ncbi:hypothetical protein Phum_PHUM037400 [Pediculus humanus corporis]|uniref:Kinetochore protein SPC25 n=1 Tax=Pediculus humanus subsp. corporis TaxID=121224 RepID=E0VAG0_PEDHC|nr:uncharacterized protein Phum_PHUM037400 [Pediculus humanus corporis]EEB10366.1 hypothetical protein Phum_PHUM037400 [Pediculus humanus corporis]